MSLSSHHLEAFMTLAETRNFTKAAEKLNVTQSALSQRILNLESELETTLIIRDRAGLQLTDVAEELLRYCRTKDLLESEFMSRLKSGSAQNLGGVIRIGGFSSIARSVLLPSLAPLLRAHPDLRLSLVSEELGDLPGLLKRGAIDFLVTDERLVRDELISHQLGEEINVLVEKKDYSGPDVYLDHDENDLTTFRYLKLLKKKPTRLHRHFVEDVYGLLDGVRMGLGRAVIPMHLLEGVDGIKILNPSVTLRVPVVLYYHEQPYYTKLHQAVVKALETKAASLFAKQER